MSPKRVRTEEIIIFWVSKVSIVSKFRFVLFKKEKEKRNFELSFKVSKCLAAGQDYSILSI